MKVLLGIVIGALLVVAVAAALFAFSWSPLRSMIAADEPAVSSGGTSESTGDSGAGGGGQATPSPQGGGQDGQYSGTGSQNLGTIEVPADSVLTWTTTEDSAGSSRSFAVMDRDFRINVSVQGEPSGQSSVEAGVYNEVTVNAVGDWTMRIEPR